MKTDLEVSGMVELDAAFSMETTNSVKPLKHGHKGERRRDCSCDFSHGYDETPLGSQFESTVHHGGEAVVVETHTKLVMLCPQSGSREG